MITLKGQNLGKRQQELNNAVNEAFAQNTSFEDLQPDIDLSDVERLFKIDLASKYENVQYIIETLKSGDSLYISRALKCIILYKDEYTNIINPEYIDEHLYSVMPGKFFRIFLIAISTYVRNVERCEKFYNYCLDIGENVIATKFLIFTSEDFKITAIRNKQPVNIKFPNFFGNSFDVLEVYIEENVTTPAVMQLLFNMRDLFSVSEVKYLQLVEKYAPLKYDPLKFHVLTDRFGIRLTKKIATKYSSRIMEYPKVYLSVLNIKELIKHSNNQEIKFYISAMMPENDMEFWRKSFIKDLLILLNAIPLENRFQYLKDIFEKTYPQKEFEMSKEFYELNLHNIMTDNRKLDWALDQIKWNYDIIGPGRGYLFYKFLNFNMAFPEIKKILRLKTKAYERRELFQILIETITSQDEMLELLNYYNNRHINESTNNKCDVIDNIFERHNIFDFNENCWASLNNLFNSLNIYGAYLDQYLHMSLLYHIIHQKTLPDRLDTFLRYEYQSYHLSQDTLRKMYKKFSDDPNKKKAVTDFFLKYYIDHVKDNKNLQYRLELIKSSFHKVNLEFKLNKTPDVKKKFAHMFSSLKDSESGSELLPEKSLTQRMLIRKLKINAVKLNDELPKIMEKADDTFNINILLRKLRVYFAEDVAKDWIEYFTRNITNETIENRKILFSIHSLIELGDKAVIRQLMLNHMPAQSKINYNEIDSNLLQTQKSICRFICYARPPPPLEDIMLYLKGDYVKYCLPIFNRFLANLLRQDLIKFIIALLDKPLSIQKHGIRLAFKCFRSDDLRTLTEYAWKRSKNVSLRKVLYTSVLNIIREENDAFDKEELFNLLIELTLDLDEVDDNAVYEHLNGRKLPNEYKPKYLEAAWRSVNKLKDKPLNLKRQMRVLEAIHVHFDVINEELIQEIIRNHINAMLFQRKIFNFYPSYDQKTWNSLKWDLTAAYLVNCKGNLGAKSAIAKTLSKASLDIRNEVRDNKYFMKEFHKIFFSTLCFEVKRSVGSRHSRHIVDVFLKDISKKTSHTENYLIVLSLRLANLMNQAKEVETDLGKAYSFGVSLRHMIVDLKASGLYYSSLYPEFEALVEETINSFEYSISDISFRTHIAEGLTKVFVKEAFIIANAILPLFDYESSCMLSRHVIDKINECGDNEVKTFLYQKFVNKDFKKRMYF